MFLSLSESRLPLLRMSTQLETSSSLSLSDATASQTYREVGDLVDVPNTLFRFVVTSNVVRVKTIPLIDVLVTSVSFLINVQCPLSMAFLS